MTDPDHRPKIKLFMADGSYIEFDLTVDEAQEVILRCAAYIKAREYGR